MNAENSRSDLESLLELLVERTCRPLTPEEDARLEQLLVLHPSIDRDELDQLAAAVELSLSPREFEPLPAALRNKILLQTKPALGEGQIQPAPVTKPTERSPSTWYLPWLITAASLLLAVWAWSPKFQPPASLAVRRAELLRAKDLVRVRLTDPASNVEEGDLVWSPAEQQGYIRITGLTANNPATSQYQLWIFDADQDERFPIDGGVFNVDRAGKESIVPIHAALRVGKPVMFAVTAEKPGGVVVSTREQLKLIGKVGG